MMLNIASLTLSVVGRVDCPGTAISGRPFACPAMTRNVSSPAAPIRNARLRVAGAIFAGVYVSIFRPVAKAMKGIFRQRHEKFVRNRVYFPRDRPQ
jgi:hypothetical protein